MRKRISIGLALTAALCACLFTACAKAPSRRPDVHYVPTPHEVVQIMLDLARVNEGDLVYDLGCGDGRIAIAAAKSFGARARGFDIDPAMVRKSIRNVKEAGVEDLVTIEERDIFELDLGEASVVALYLLPHLNIKLLPQFEKMRPGSRVVSHDFGIKGAEPEVEVTMRLENGEIRKVYLWTTPFVKTRPSEKRGAI